MLILANNFEGSKASLNIPKPQKIRPVIFQLWRKFNGILNCEIGFFPHKTQYVIISLNNEYHKQKILIICL